MATAKRHIEDWLAERGMGKYAPAFAEQCIDLSILPELTDTDFEKLGVVLGDRRKILRWIADLDGVSYIDPSVSSDQSALAAERRQVTVLFSDLVDSTGLSRRLDPEDLRAVIRDYQEAVTKIVRANDGFVAGFRGDGVLVYFGYPQAHEDDVERAVRAALELIPAVDAITAAAPLQTRVGIATGLVVVGDLIGSGDTQERNMVGDTPNLAARLLSLAEPNSVVIADEARELLGDFFDFEDLGLRHVKGIEQPVRSWIVMNPRTVESRFDALHGAALTEFSGREDELQHLLKRWSKARAGDGQVVLISGEPGIGKSRLTAALMEAIADEPHSRLRYFCSPQHTDSAFYPVIGHLERAANFAHGDDAETKLDKLEKLLTANAVTAEGKSLVAALLSLPTDRYPAIDYDAAQRRIKTMEALHGQVVTLSARQPVLIILEDAHWIDPTSHEAFGRTVEKLKSLPVLLVITYRPEFVAPWIGDSHVTTITLNRLGNREASQIVASLAGNKPMSAETIANIVDRSDGIPLFLEEMTKAVLEAESEGDARRAIKAVPSQKSAVPASLHASLMARLDRLGAAKGIAQVGAAIGRSFSHQLLASVVRGSVAEFLPLLDRLVASGLLFRQGQPPDASYLFKHALIRDAAYSMLLREPRRALHVRILEALEAKFPDIAESQPEVLAHHASEAGQIEKAAALWGRTGQQSLGRSALNEAVSQLTQAQELLASLPNTSEIRQQQISIQVQLATAVSQLTGYSSAETKAAYEGITSFIEKAEMAGDVLSNPMQPFVSLWGLWLFYLVAYDRPLEKKTASLVYDFAQKHGGRFQKMIAENVTAISNFWVGRFIDAKAGFERSLELYSVEEHRPLLILAPQDTRAHDLGYLAWTLWPLGYPDVAREYAERAVAEARELNHANTLMWTLHALAWLHVVWTKEYSAAVAAFDEIAELATKQSAVFWQAHDPIARAAVLVQTGEPNDAQRCLDAGLAAWRKMGATIALPHFLTIKASIEAHLGNCDEARRVLEENLSASIASEQRYTEAGILQAAGEIALMMPRRDEAKAEAYFQQGLVFCRERSHKGTELRLALLLARLWRDQGKQREAYELLAPVYNWFTEGFDWTDMKQAKALLDELKAQID